MKGTVRMLAMLVTTVSSSASEPFPFASFTSTTPDEIVCTVVHQPDQENKHNATQGSVKSQAIATLQIQCNSSTKQQRHHMARTVGMQQNSASPVRNSVGSRGSRVHTSAASTPPTTRERA